MRYKTIYGKGMFKGLEKETNKLLIDIDKPNKKGIRWIGIHNHSLGAFTVDEVTIA
jgi:hypothetical protein